VTEPAPEICESEELVPPIGIVVAFVAREEKSRWTLFYTSGDLLRGRWGYFSHLNVEPIFWHQPSPPGSTAHAFSQFAPASAYSNENGRFERSSRDMPQGALKFVLAKTVENDCQPNNQFLHPWSRKITLRATNHAVGVRSQHLTLVGSIDRVHIFPFLFCFWQHLEKCLQRRLNIKLEGKNVTFEIICTIGGIFCIII
jgi:hypothetical protein